VAAQQIKAMGRLDRAAQDSRSDLEQAGDKTAPDGQNENIEGTSAAKYRSRSLSSRYSLHRSRLAHFHGTRPPPTDPSGDVAIAPTNDILLVYGKPRVSQIILDRAKFPNPRFWL
jgi:hypothetical protein